MNLSDSQVVITGLGIVSSVGLDVGSFRRALSEGQSGIAPLADQDAGDLPTTVAARVKDFNIFNYVPSKKPTKFMGRITGFLVTAAGQAINDAKLDSKSWDSTRVGVVLGSNADDFNFEEIRKIVECMRSKERPVDDRDIGPLYNDLLGGFSYLKSIPNMGANFISMFHRVQGYSATVCTLTCSSIQALGFACDLIEQGEVDVIICGGGDSWIHPYGLIAYNGLEPLCSASDHREACRPFDRLRNGVVMGEGAACLILESREHAAKRGVSAYAAVEGWSTRYSSGNGWNAVAASFAAAVDDAGLCPEEVSAVLAHGASSPVLDSIESRALSSVFGEGPDSVPVFSIMPFCGHTVAGMGAMQTVAASLALKEGMLFGVPTHTVPDPLCPVNVVHRTRPSFLKHILISSINYDHAAAALVLGQGNRAAEER